MTDPNTAFLGFCLTPNPEQKHEDRREHKRHRPGDPKGKGWQFRAPYVNEQIKLFG